MQRRRLRSNSTIFSPLTHEPDLIVLRKRTLLNMCDTSIITTISYIRSVVNALASRKMSPINRVCVQM